ncbi:antitoxin Xre/MbcA/ParS toxin-binding domain-containing protein [Paenibacillus sp. sgz500992]
MAEWLFRKVPALDNIQPYELLHTERGMRILKEALMRFP